MKEPGSPQEELASLPGGEQESLWKAFSEARREVRAIPESWAQREENLGFDFYATHPSQNLTMRFGMEGVQFVSSDRTYTEEDFEKPSTTWAAKMRLVKFAGETITGWAQPEKSAQSGSRTEYRHGAAITEWFENGVEGMEHGYTIAARPGNLDAGEEVSFEVALEGLSVTERDDDSLSFRDGEREVLSYSKLLVFDAEGKELPATMKPSGKGFLLAYNDARAVYPVTVDPLIVNEEAKLNRVNGAANDGFGNSVAISGDFVVIGSPDDDEAAYNAGGAYVFEKVGSRWDFRAKLAAGDAAANDNFGQSVAISGEALVIGAHTNDDAGSNSGSAYVFIESNGTWSQQAKLTASDAAAGDQFGWAVAISGEVVVVSAPNNDAAGSDSGSAYVFTRTGIIWSQQGKLTASDAAAGASFGSAVGVSGETIIVGAPDASDTGVAYVFVRSGASWSQQARLTASDGASKDFFGISVAISENSVLVGAHGNDDTGSGSGSAYVFVRSGISWSAQAKLTAGDAAANDAFGGAVSISGDSLLVGAVGDDDGALNSGSAYVFVRSGSAWSQQAKLTADDAATSDSFGNAVSVSGDSVIVGAWRDDDVGENSGSVYVFTRNGVIWSEQAKLTSSDVGHFDYFGISIAISGDTVVIGAEGDNDGGSSSGSAYIFTRTSSVWSQQAKLTASDARSSEYFGNAVAISGDTVVVGAYRAESADRRWAQSGKAHVFVRHGTRWSEQAKLTAGTPGDVLHFGTSVSISGETLIVGVPGEYIGESILGSVHVFVRSGTTWTRQAMLNGSRSQIGNSIAISGDTVAAGSPRDAFRAESAGSVSLFVRSGDTWRLQSRVYADDAAIDDYFGTSVSISDDTLVVGAFRDDDGGEDSGSAYVFQRGGVSWSQQAKLRANDAAEGDIFGDSVAISGDRVVVGALGNDDAGSASGSAYLFTRSGVTWTYQRKLIAGDAAEGDYFGASVAISGDTVVVGVPRDDHAKVQSGSVYLYRIALSSARELLVFNHLGVELGNGSLVTSSPGQLLGMARDYSFQLGNAGTLDLDIQSISLGGSDAGQFALSLPNISSTVDLSANERIDFTISFTPTGGSGVREAIVIITSNDSSNPVFSFNLMELGLSNTADGDGDGMTDWGEYSMRGFGFDWETSQPNLVGDYYSQAHTTGLYNQAELAGVAGSVTLLNADAESATVDLVIELQESSDLETYTRVTLDGAKLSVDGEGSIRYKLDTAEGKRFYRAEWQGE